MGTVVIFEYTPEDSLQEVRRTRSLTGEEMERLGPSYGRDAASLLHDEWMADDRGPGYYRVLIQEEHGLQLRLLAEAGERRENVGSATIEACTPLAVVWTDHQTNAENDAC